MLQLTLLSPTFMTYHLATRQKGEDLQVFEGLQRFEEKAGKTTGRLEGRLDDTDQRAVNSTFSE